MRGETYKISVIVPMYYEEEVITQCNRRLTQVLSSLPDYEIVYVNDGSKDKTLPMLRELAEKDDHLTVVSFSRNFGHQAAVTAGVRQAQGDAVVIIDADMQDPPELIIDMVKLWTEGWDVVYAQRKARQGETIFKKLTAKTFYRTLRALTDTDIPADTGDFRLMDKKVADAFDAMPEHNRFIRGMVAWMGYKQTPIEYVRNERYAGSTKYPFKKMMKLAGDGIMSFSVKPLKIVMQMGMLSIFVSFLVLLYALIVKFSGHAVMEGWTSIMVIITFLGGVQLMSIGVLGQYISRIYDEVRNRPLFLVDEVIRKGKSDR